MIPVHQCSHAGCHELIPFNQTYCKKHQYKRQASKTYTYQHRKAIYGKYGKFYKSARWTRTSRLYRAKHPLCVRCLKQKRYRLAQVVDHIVPIRTENGWKMRFNEQNFQSLCISCHNIKTMEDQEKYHFPKLSAKHEH